MRTAAFAISNYAFDLIELHWWGHTGVLVGNTSTGEILLAGVLLLLAFVFCVALDLREFFRP